MLCKLEGNCKLLWNVCKPIVFYDHPQREKLGKERLVKDPVDVRRRVSFGAHLDTLSAKY